MFNILNENTIVDGDTLVIAPTVKLTALDKQLAKLADKEAKLVAAQKAARETAISKAKDRAHKKHSARIEALKVAFETKVSEADLELNKTLANIDRVFNSQNGETFANGHAPIDLDGEF